ncbi:MAG: family 1 encapsulin nanocompartment shell protein [Spirochaetaceae bacterium]
MSILRRSMAPISEAAWEEIDSTARQCFETTLSVRRFADVVGPKGIGYSAVPTGRIEMPDSQPKSGARYGLRRTLPMLEVRVPFELSVWELDNITRGARDIDLEPLENAAWEAARFEEEAVYKGLADAGIAALKDASSHADVPFGNDLNNMIPAVASAVTQLRKSMIEGPYALIVTEPVWNHLLSAVNGRPLKHHVEYILNGPVIFSPFIGQSMLVSIRGGDLELVLGQDLSIGYESHSTDSVRLFFTESFGFRVIDPKVMIFFK